jgi:hypothetical protein
MNTGKAGAFRFLQPAQSDLSKTILQQEQMNTIHQEKKEAKQKQQTQDNLNDLEDLGKINSGERTGYNHIDAAFIDAYNRKGGLVDQYVEAKKRLKNSNNTDAEAYGIIKNIEKYTSELSSMKQGFVKIASELQSGIAQGKYSAELNKGFLSNIDKIEKGGIFINTDNLAELNIENLGFDLNNDGLPEKINLKTFQDPRNFGIFENDFNINEYNTTLAKELGTFEETKLNPNGNNRFESLTTEGLNPANKLLVKDRYKSVFGEDIKNLTNAGKSILYQYKSNPNISQEEYEAFIDARVTDFENASKKKRIEKMDWSARNAAAKSSGRTTVDKTKDSLRTTIDGIISGDDKYLKGLIGQKMPGKTDDKKDVLIENTEFVEGKFIVSLSNGDVLQIDTKDKQKAIGDIIGLVRPFDKRDQALEEYNKGTATETFTKGGEQESKILKSKQLKEQTEKALKEIPDSWKSDDLVPYLESKGFKGFEDTGGRFTNTVKMPNGVEVNVNTKSGMEKLKQYIKDNVGELMGVKEAAPEPKEKNKRTVNQIMSEDGVSMSEAIKIFKNQ